MNLRRISILAFTVAANFLTGCGFTSSTPVAPGGPSAKISGTVHGGQQPVLGATVSVVAVGTAGYGSTSTVLATVSSSLVDGSFSFPSGAYTCPYANTPVYLLAHGGDAGAGTNSLIGLAAGLGPCSSAPSQHVILNEVTTVATAFAMGQFFTTSLGGTDDFGANSASPGVYSPGLVMANSYTIPMLVDLATGTVNADTATVHIEAAKIYSIANTIAACVNSSGDTGSGTPCGRLIADTAGDYLPSDTLQAAVQLSLYPYQDVTDLYSLATPTAPFVGLSTAPNDFTIGVSYKTNAMGLGINGAPGASGASTSIDIDETGRVWFPSNLSGAAGVGYFDPSTNSFGGPFNQLSYLVRPQYVAIDQLDHVWVTDQGSGFVIAENQLNPDVLSGGWFTGTQVGGPIAIDASGSVFFAEEATDGSATTLFQGPSDISADVSPIATFGQPPTALVDRYAGPGNYQLYAPSNGISSNCNLEVQQSYSGGSFVGGVAETGNTTPCASGGIALTNWGDVLMSETTANELCSYESLGCFTPGVPLHQPQAIALDGLGYLWIANSGDGSISTLNSFAMLYQTTSSVEYLHDTLNGGTMGAPYGLAIDNSGNVWVSNAGCVSTSTTPCTPSSFHLSELIGAAAPTITPLSAQLNGSYAGVRPELRQSGHADRVKLPAQHPTVALQQNHLPKIEAVVIHP